jgi:hypothetical protein
MNQRGILFALVIAAAGCGGEQKKQAGAPDPKLAREQALKDAQNAGILGSLSAGDGGAFGSLVGYGDVSSGFDDDDVYGGLTGEDYGYGGSADPYADWDSGWGDPRGCNGGGGCDGVGTIGTGSGTGEGYGYDSTHATSDGGYGIGNGGGHVHEDRVLITVDLPASGYDAHDIVAALRDHMSAFESCSKTSGTVSVSFTIETDGTVSHVKADGIGKAAAKCVAHVIGAVALIPPDGGAPVDVMSTFDY